MKVSCRARSWGSRTELSGSVEESESNGSNEDWCWSEYTIFDCDARKTGSYNEIGGTVSAATFGLFSDSGVEENSGTFLLTLLGTSDFAPLEYIRLESVLPWIVLNQQRSNRTNLSCRSRISNLQQLWSKKSSSRTIPPKCRTTMWTLERFLICIYKSTSCKRARTAPLMSRQMTGTTKPRLISTLKYFE